MSEDFLSDYIAKLEADNTALRIDLAAARTEIARLRAELEPVAKAIEGRDTLLGVPIKYVEPFEPAGPVEFPYNPTFRIRVTP